MAAGLGFKDFVTGEVLTAADVDGYLMQGVWVFASATARDAAVTSPQEGNFAYLKDTNVTTYYNGSAWANLDTTGMTNPMTTTGDTIYSSSGSTPARLGIGTTGQVLTVAGGVPSWATPASGGGMTLLSTTTLSGSSTTISSIDQGYNNLFILITGVTTASGGLFRFKINNVSGVTNFVLQSGASQANTTNYAYLDTDPYFGFSNGPVTTDADNVYLLEIFDYAATNRRKLFTGQFGYDYSGGNEFGTIDGIYKEDTAVSSMNFFNGSTLNSGTVRIYGVK
jgi:hypothetical protein